MPASDALDRFSAPTRAWFSGSFAAPTAAQVGAWESIAAGEHTLVIAPTGSGKTLSAFLWAIDRLASADSPGATASGEDQAPSSGPRRTKVLYISPLKALAVDVERNLRAPLTGIAAAATAAGVTPPKITVGIRSGDTPAAARRQLVRTPPDILITTPESLYLMLTSAARETLTEVDTVIVDEVHAVAGTKRGTHLALSLERLDAQLAKPAQRIGLSATVRPPEAVAAFLGGSRPCRIVDPPAAKTFELRIDVPVEDMANIPADDVDPLPGDDALSPTAGSIWPAIERSIADEILANRATIVFANSRRLAERLTAALNEIYARQEGYEATETRNHQNPGGGPSAITTGNTPAMPLDAPVLARAHHGSVSKEQRAQIEDDLKSGRLRCVVATSSLELGIDMGAVDLVIQVESPPSVASGLQRVGRAGHQVGEISRGILYPKHRTDLIHTTVAAARMRDGLIEQLAIPSNPLDVLAQQTIAAAAVDDLDVDEWYDTVRRAAPYKNLGRDVYEATLDLISGRFPSEEFAELRPRVTWDRAAGTLTGRRGALRLAVTSGGTIPDRGLFGVFLAGDEDGPRRVGELDEEMVYESRVGDVFALGASSWRIAEITHDRVLVTPAPGLPGRLPFWIGDTVGRPAELGAAIGQFTGQVANSKSMDAAVTELGLGLTDFARGNLTALIGEQRDATGTVPTDRTLVVERFRDELGDWRVILHSPYGLRVHAPWASAISNRLKATLGLEGAVSAADDGIVVRLPDTDDAPPGPEVFLVDPDEIEALVTDALAGSPLFAARFRECAARALLLPRRDPGRRSPLWQQRQRSAQLLGVASRYPDFPIVLEAVRECLQDVYDLPALHDLLTRIARRQVRLTAVETPSASPFAAALLFDYIGAYMYADDTPIAERRAAALSLDTALLAQLLGRLDLRELLDDQVIAEVVARLQRLDPARQAHDAQDVGDLLRWLGPLTTDEIAQRYRGEKPLDAVLDSLRGQVFLVTHHGRERWAAVEDAGRLRDGLGIALPPGVPVAFTEPVDDPLGDLVGRYARTHGPFTTAQATEGIGLPPAVVGDILDRLARDRRVVEGEFLVGVGMPQWCHPDVLGQIRRGSLAATRSAIAPVDHASFARFLLDWQHVSVNSSATRGVDGVASVIDQLAGVPIPASAWESLVLPARVRDYSPSMLDELLSTGETVWSGHGAIGSSDGWVALHPADLTAATLPPPDDVEITGTMTSLIEALETGGALRLPDLIAGLDAPGDVTDSVWALVWSGRVANDSFAPVRALLSGRGGSASRSTPSHRSRRTPRLRGARLSGAYLAGASGPGSAVAATIPGVLSGRWFLLERPEVDPTAATSAVCEVLLERYGVVTKGAVHNEGVPGGFSRVYRALTVFEDGGKVRRGYYVDGLGGAQFAVPTTVDALRDHTTVRREHSGRAIVLAATDPANPYGAALDWPESGGSHRPGRKAGALVVLVDGELACFVERGGKTVLTFTSRNSGFRYDRSSVAVTQPTGADERGEEVDRDPGSATALADLVRAGRVERLAIDTVDGEPVQSTEFGKQLLEAGFTRTPRGVRLRYGSHA